MQKGLQKETAPYNYRPITDDVKNTKENQQLKLGSWYTIH